MSEQFEQPRSRNEAILQNMLGADNQLLEPVSRIEKLLMQILDSGGSGGGMPEKPSAAGQYTLQVTIVDDEPVYAWMLLDLSDIEDALDALL